MVLPPLVQVNLYPWPYLDLHLPLLRLHLPPVLYYLNIAHQDDPYVYVQMVFVVCAVRRIFFCFPEYVVFLVCELPLYELLLHVFMCLERVQKTLFLKPEMKHLVEIDHYKNIPVYYLQLRNLNLMGASHAQNGDFRYLKVSKPRKFAAHNIPSSAW